MSCNTKPISKEQANKFIKCLKDYVPYLKHNPKCIIVPRND